MEVLKLSANNEVFNITDYTQGDQLSVNNNFLSIVQDADISVAEQEVYTTNEDNLVSRTVPVNIINISDDQILRIELQNGSSLVNTEFIVDENLLNPEYVSHCTNEKISDVGNEKDNIKSQNGTTFSMDSNDNEILSAVASLSKYNDVNLSLPSPETDEELPSETDLTSLNWLHNITNIMAVPNLPTPPISPPPNAKKFNGKQSGNCQEDLTINIDFYKKNGDKKPPFSYATLICMAMSKNGNKMTLSAIYSWIRENFLYYRKAHPSWQVRLIYVNLFWKITLPTLVK